jgi:hypothetical protein
MSESSFKSWHVDLEYLLGLAIPPIAIAFVSYSPTDVRRIERGLPPVTADGRTGMATIEGRAREAQERGLWAAPRYGRPDLAVTKPWRATKEMGGAEPPAAIRSALYRASMARMASTGPSPK